jgi:hypothetical protein
LDAKLLAEVISDPMRSLKMIHHSWYEDVLGYSPKALQDSLKKLFSNAFGALDNNRSPVVEFLLNYVIHRWPDSNKLPVETLHDHPLFGILHMNAQTLERLASLFSVHEMVESVRKIVDKKTLHRVLNVLSAIQQRYLRTLLQRKSEGLPTKLSCQDLIKKSKEDSERLLLECGYSQLCSLLSGRDELFYWHLLHRLERNFAEQLQKRIQDARCDQDKHVFERRLKSITQFLQKGERL